MRETPQHILLVDDDVEILQLLEEFLGRQGYRVTVTTNSLSAEQIMQNEAVNLVILDVMLGGESGLELCRLLRKTYNTPIMMLTAIADEVEEIVALEIGADVYITKPVNPRLLLAYVRTILRQANSNRKKSRTTDLEEAEEPIYSFNEIYFFSGYSLNSSNHSLSTPNNIHHSLSNRELSLLLGLIRFPKTALKREKLIKLMKLSDESNTRMIDILINRLRTKIEINPEEPTIIKTIRGHGYMLDTEVTKKKIKV